MANIAYEYKITELSAAPFRMFHKILSGILIMKIWY